MILIFFFFSVKILYRTKFSFQPKLAGMAEMTRNMPKFSFFSSLLACRKCRSRVGAVSEPCRRRVGACRRNEKKKKKKEDTRRTPESSESYPFRCPTRVRHRHDAKNGVSVQPSVGQREQSQIMAILDILDFEDLWLGFGGKMAEI